MVVITYENAVSDNLNLLKYIIQHMNANELHTIKELFSPDFVYISPQSAKLNFEEYCSYVAQLSQSFEVETEKIEGDGDVFTVKFSFIIVDNTHKYYSEVKSLSTYTIYNNQLLKMEITYNLTPEDQNYLRKVMAKYYKK